jgi:hypothetical protein
MNLAWLLVAAVYALGIALARRKGIDIPKRIAVLFFLLTLLFLWRPLTQRVVHAPMDVLQFVPPWTSLAPPELKRETASNYEMQDVVMQMIPWSHQVREAWRGLRPPLWNELSGCGYPLLANAQSAALSPLRILALPLPLPYAMAAEAGMKILIALTFTFLYCRRRYDALPSLAGAIAFGFGTFLTIWLHFPHATVAAFLPAVLYAIDLLAERRTRARFTFAALLGPLVLFGGHPETTLHIVFFATLYAAWIALVERPPETLRLIGALAGAAVVAALLSLPFLIPVAEGVRQSARYLELEVRPHSGIAFSDFPSLTLLFQPRFFGARPGPTWGPAAAESLCGFAGLLGIGAWFALLFRAIARREFRTREFFYVVATLLLFLLLDDFAPLSKPFQAAFPLALHMRLRLPFMLLTAVMAAAVLHRGRTDRSTQIATIAGALGVLTFLMLRTHFPSDDARRFAMLAMLPSLAVLVAFATRIRPAVAAAIFVELWITAHAFNPVRPRKEFYPRTPLVEALLQQPRNGWRVLGIGGAMFPNANALFGIEDARAHDPMAGGRYIRLLQQHTENFDTREYYAKWKDTRTRLIDYVGARWIATDAKTTLDDTGRYRLIYEGNDGRLYENKDALPRFFAPRNVIVGARSHDDWRDTAFVDRMKLTAVMQRDLLSPRPIEAPVARVTITKPNELQVDAPRHTLIVSSIAWWKGWLVTWNGERLEPELVNGAFLGFVVPPGRGIVRVRYLPMTFYAGAAIALVTLLALLYHPRPCSTRPGST